MVIAGKRARFEKDAEVGTREELTAKKRRGKARKKKGNSTASSWLKERLMKGRRKELCKEQRKAGNVASYHAR
jgi:hypothetical protein